MNIQAEKLAIMKLILETENTSVLESIKNIFKKDSKTDFWETLPHYQKEDILQGIQEIDNGDTVDYEDFIKKHR